MKGESCVLIEGGVLNRVWLYIYIYFSFLLPRVTDVPSFFGELVGFFSGFLPSFFTHLGVASVHDTRRQSYLLTVR